MEGILVPITLFIVIGAICIAPVWLKSRERTEMQSTLRAAIEKGQPVPPEVIEALTRNVKVAPTSLSDLRAGVIWAAVGIGFGLFSYLADFEDHDFRFPGLGIAAIPLMIGLAYIVLSFFNPSKAKRV
ncbi:MAG: hypothetical protein KKC14_18515 [Alphaproteobacteria bacterium]|nr:hypothetical protein [Alphaproteobacteria bacterium]